MTVEFYDEPIPEEEEFMEVLNSEVMKEKFDAIIEIFKRVSCRVGYTKDMAYDVINRRYGISGTWIRNYITFQNLNDPDLIRRFNSGEAITSILSSTQKGTLITCKKCGETKDGAEFNWSCKVCKSCHNKSGRKHKAITPEKVAKDIYNRNNKKREFTRNEEASNTIGNLEFHVGKDITKFREFISVLSDVELIELTARVTDVSALIHNLIRDMIKEVSSNEEDI